MPSLEERFRPISFKAISDLVKPKVQKMFANALEGVGNSNSQSNSDTEMTDLSDIANITAEAAIKREKLVFLTYISALSVSSACTTEPHVLEFLPILAHYSNDTK